MLKVMVFCHLQEKVEINMMLMDAATKAGIYSAIIAYKKVVQKTAEATGDLIGNEIAGKITSAGKTKSKEKENENEINKRRLVLDAI